MPCKLNVILDIDETLVHFIGNRYKAHSWDTLSEKEKEKYEVIETSNGLFLKRPHLDKFFDFLFEHCNVGLWTWSEMDYAKPFAAKFILKDHPERKLAFIYVDENAEASADLHGNSKDLNYLWYGVNGEKESLKCFSECNTILIDDLPGNSANSSNLRNSITIEPFAPFGEVKNRSDPYKDCSNDDGLLEAIRILKKVMKPASKCYDTDEQWDNIFNDTNIKAAGLGADLKNIKLKNGRVVKGIGAGKSHFFVGASAKSSKSKRAGRAKKTRKLSR